MSSVPALPGEIIRGEHAEYLKHAVRELLGINTTKFPGSQPVSFMKKDLARLEVEDYWVCEKSDGIRVLVFIMLVPHTNEQEIYLIDRKNEYRRVNGLYFPHFEDPRMGLENTLLDGELVMDISPSGRETLRLLAFDCIAVNGISIMEKSLTSRYGKLDQWVVRPFEKMLRDVPAMGSALPFEIKVKRMERSYSIELVLKEVIPKLEHKHDGLIYSCASSGYVIGTDNRILKWKPPSENSIDFKLELRFPPSKLHGEGLDYYSKPTFLLMQWCGGKKYDFFDTIRISDEGWEKMKETCEQYDDRIVEVVWDFQEKNWKILRFRDDKTDGNHRDIVANILVSITDGVEVDELIKNAPEVRAAWKLRESSGPSAPGQPPAPANTLPPRPPPQQQRQLRYVPMPPNEYGRVSGPIMVAGMLR
ncbi:Dcp1p-Dcp2p decapping enzyme complex alpha subunit [Tulasnella sp. JGI-2019a]|nr:Dcp1p-Dcp2p decapping enzyme complex alpha subunit [Tulasnella sp. JGI-2019a]KAG9012367.1 Dcp1p-Dcp2p decapping enzyme complex alpha subunit [Tulasnella sp. JGI-2019a]